MCFNAKILRDKVLEIAFWNIDVLIGEEGVAGAKKLMFHLVIAVHKRVLFHRYIPLVKICDTSKLFGGKVPGSFLLRESIACIVPLYKMPWERENLKIFSGYHYVKGSYDYGIPCNVTLKL